MELIKNVINFHKKFVLTMIYLACGVPIFIILAALSLSQTLSAFDQLQGISFLLNVFEYVYCLFWIWNLRRRAKKGEFNCTENSLLHIILSCIPQLLAAVLHIVSSFDKQKDQSY